jgi:hypothetical protein
MKKCLIAISLFFISCAVGPAPKFPEEVKEYFVTMVEGEPLPEYFYRAVVNPEEIKLSDSKVVEVHCAKFEIVEQHPVSIKFIEEVGLKSCHLVGGFGPSDTQKLFNYINDMWDWAETRKKCFK